MDYSDSLAVFRAQTVNVHALNSARTHTLRAINEALRNGRTSAAGVHTSTYALIYCAWAEANFSKMIHTPYGFSLDEMAEIKEKKRKSGFESGWNTTLALGVKRMQGSHDPNMLRKLQSIVKVYIGTPAEIRNRIAHGQWVIALNSDNTAENSNLTQSLQQLDVVQVDIWFGVVERLFLIVETLIESPGKAFHRDYLPLVMQLDNFITESSNWSLASKVATLQAKAQWAEHCKSIHQTPGTAR